ncbi:N,N-dimethylformamidase beta subunit family domain-containing protein [Pseudonocardia zijingensis]|uniref:N,N-dimethylformamidase beta subunit family domain-containing protein n=2 Tax=Pseudonocardia zijingensis TaxID=153376 RepID=UPI0036175044
MRIVGYADRLSVRAGDPITFHVSCTHEGYRPEIVRLRRGGSERHGAALVEEPGASGLPDRLPGRVQTTTSGSFVEAGAIGPMDAVGLAIWFRPTLPGAGARPLLAVGDLVLEVSAAGIALRRGGTGLAAVEAPPTERRWTFAAATVDATGEVRLALHRPGMAPAVGTAQAPPSATTGPLRIGSDGAVTGGLGATFNGKVARPVVAATAWPESTTAALAAGADPLTLLEPAGTSALDLAADPGGTRVPDRGGLTGGATVHHLPTRGVPGPFWSGAETDFRRAPAEFDALHLHDDDLADAGWEPDLTWDVPAELASGVYALKTTAAGDVDRIPFVVTPARHEAPVLVVLPTWTYLAYANWRTYAEYEAERLVIYGEARGIDERDRWLAAHPELGRSLYDVHTDGSGVCHTSRLRPIVNLRPDYFTPTTRGFRHYAQDLLLLDWLDRRGERYAVVTDDEVEREGTDLLSRYDVVLTGSHPEYCSAGMLDAYLAYTHAGGRLMYLGGNGFYQVTARHPGHPDALEIRRGHAGVATWVSDPGEEHLASTGERGGLWRLRGRAPNVLAGVGFTAQGFDSGYGYRRTAASADPAAAWVFDGVPAGVGDVFGTEGPGLGGAAGDELDRADVTLGTPPDAVVLASSVGHTEKIELVPEEADHGYAAPPPGVHPKVRADVVLLGRPGGGAVFSVGSIAWSTAMTHNGGDNAVSRITANVLDRFRDEPGPVLGRQ